jgi:phosphoglycolate phosphatase
MTSKSLGAKRADTAGRIDLLTFDLDGTLVDTAAEIAEAVNRALADVDVAPCPQPQIESLIGAGAHELMRRLLAQIDPAQRLDRALVLARLDHHYAETAGTHGVTYPGAHACLQALRDDGVRLGLVTNKELRHARRVLDANDLTGYFEQVIGGDSLAWKKPDARVLQHVMAMLRSEPARTAHLGDSATDLRAARNAGVADWAVPWGYNAGEPVENDRPSRMFQSLPQVAEHVLSLRQGSSASDLSVTRLAGLSG